MVGKQMLKISNGRMEIESWFVSNVKISNGRMEIES